MTPLGYAHQTPSLWSLSPFSLTMMAKTLFFSAALVILLITSPSTISTAQAVSCTMCDSCDNPCLPPASPPPPPPPPPSGVGCPPPPKSGTYYTPPPPASGGSGGGNSYYYPPPASGGGSGNWYPTPPPPNPILPYFPFIFYGPPSPGKGQTSDSYWIKSLPSVYLLFVLWLVI